MVRRPFDLKSIINDALQMSWFSGGMLGKRRMTPLSSGLVNIS